MNAAPIKTISPRPRWSARVFKASPPPLRPLRLNRTLVQMLAAALIIAVVFWGFALWLRATDRFLIWDDLLSTFHSADVYLLQPYQSPGYFAMPWGMVLLLPFAPLPLEAAALVMIMLYFALLACLIYKFGGGRVALLIALTSALAVDTALEINIDWMVVIGMLVPPVMALPFLLIKPQTALAYAGAFTRSQIVHGGIVLLVVLLASLLIWGDWPLDLLDNMRRYETNRAVNLAPMALIPPLIALTLGIVGLFIGFIRRDAIILVLAGLCFTPYIAPNSVLVAFALVSARWTRFALLFSFVIWLFLLTILF